MLAGTHSGSTNVLSSGIPGGTQAPSSASPPSIPEVQPELLCPLQEVVGGPQAKVHTPCSLSNLNHCCTCLDSFSEDPSRFTEEFQGLTLSFDLTWKDLNILLSHCCTTEEKTLIWLKHMLMELHIAQPHQYPVGLTPVPLMDPSWE